MKKISLAVVAVMMVAMLAVFTGCGASSSSGSGSDASGDQSLQKVLDKGTLVLGLDDSFPPMGFRDDKNNIVGFDIDVATEVAKRMGVTLKLQPIDWATKEMELTTGSIDCVWNGMSIDAERQKAMDLSDPYMTNNMVFVVLKNSSYNDQASLAGKTIGVQNGSTAEKILDASDLAKTIKQKIGFKDNVTAFMDLETKGIDSIFMDEVVANYVINYQHKDFKVLPNGLKQEEYAVGFKKGSVALKDEVNKYLKQMKQDGSMAKLSEKWIGKDVISY